MCPLYEIRLVIQIAENGQEVAIQNLQKKLLPALNGNPETEHQASICKTTITLIHKTSFKQCFTNLN